MCALGLQVWRAPRDGAYERFSEEATPDLRGGDTGSKRRQKGGNEGREKDEEISRKRGQS